MRMRLLIIAGGTGGHIFPALAVAQALRKKGVDVQWLGANGGLEEKLIPRCFPLHLVHIKVFRGKSGLQKFFMLFHLARACFQAYCIVRRLKPKVILGMGSYVAGPGGLAALVTHTPLIIHEQNSIAGLTNRVLAKMAKSVLQGFPQAFHGFHKKVITTGNPVRAELLKTLPPQERFKNRHGSLRILVLGGSQGARPINQKIMAALSHYPRPKEITLWHQTGDFDFESTQKMYEKIAVKAKVHKFIHEIADAYSWADLIVCRSGALTVSEITSVGVASILIPYPYAVDDHQLYNARFLEQAGAAIIIPEKVLTETDLIRWFEQLAQNRNQLLIMAKKARSLAKPEAVEDIVIQCKQYYAAQ